MFNTLFRKRIGLPENNEITFNDLDDILEKTATVIPFENLRVIDASAEKITKENVMDKILVRNEGGLCYELNTNLYFFLLDNGFDVSLVRGVVYNHTAQEWGTIGRTHVAIILVQDEKKYIVDTGFGGNLPLKPVPLTGEVVSSFNGEFQIKNESSVHGNYILHVKLKHKDADWKVGYAFDSQQLVGDLSELNEVQKIITEHPKSIFNKSPLVTKLIKNGSLTLTENSFTQWMNGEVIKEEIDFNRFKDVFMQYFK